MYSSGCLFYLLSPYSLEKSMLPDQFSVLAYALRLLPVQLAVSLLRRMGIERNMRCRVTLFDAVLLCYAVYLFCFETHTLTETTELKYIALCFLYLSLRTGRSEYAGYYSAVLVFSGVFHLLYEAVYSYPAGGISFTGITGSFYNTGIWGGFLAILTVTGTGLLLTARKKTVRFAVAALLPVYTYAVASSGSRSAWLAVAAGIIFLIRPFARPFVCRFPAIRKSLPAGMLLLLPVLFTALCRYRTESVQGRLLIWRVTAGMIQSRPVLGHGIDGFARNYMVYQGDYFSGRSSSALALLADNNLFAFNEGLSLCSEQGLIGTAFLAVLLGILFFKAAGKPAGKAGRIGRTAKAGLLCWLVFGCFSYPASVFQLCLVFVLLCGIIVSFHPPLFEFEIRNIRLCRLVFTLLLVMGVIGYIRFDNRELQPYQAARIHWSRAVKKYSFNEKESLRMLDSLVPVLKTTPPFLHSYGVLLNQQKEYRKAILLLTEANAGLASYATLVELGKSYRGTGNYRQAEKMWRQAARMVPNRFEPYYLLMQLHYEQKNFGEAGRLASYLAGKQVKIPSFRIDEITEAARKIEKEICANKIEPDLLIFKETIK